MHAQRNVSNSSGAIPNINTTRILEKKANWHPKNDHTHSLIPLCTYRYVFMPHGMQGRKNQEIKGTSPDPLPPSGSQKGGGAGYARLIHAWLIEKVRVPSLGCMGWVWKKWVFYRPGGV